MAAPPFFSICIPCFDHGKYVGKTIGSVLDQDFRDLEIVVADNASTDDSREIVRSFDDPRVRLVENPWNIGFAPNLQRVTAEAKGRFVNLLSSDDIMRPGALRTYAALIEERKADADRLVLMSQAYEIDGRGKTLRYVTRSRHSLAPARVQLPTSEEIEAQPLAEDYAGADAFAECMRSLETAGLFCTVTYARALWVAVGGYNSTQLINPDKHFVHKLLRMDPRVVHVNRPLYGYRKHEEGQAAQQARARVLKRQVDDYGYLMRYDEAWLAGTGVTPADQRREFVERACVDEAISALTRGRWTDASRLMTFAWSAYPRSVLASPRAWAVASLLATGPVGAGVAKLARKVRGEATLPKLADLARPVEWRRR